MDTIQYAVNERVAYIQREYLGLTQRSFAEKLGVSQSSIAALFARGTRPSFDTIQKILSAFPEVSADWLILGQGAMLRDGRSLIPAAAPGPEPGLPVLPFNPEIQQAELTMLRAQLEHQKAQIDYLMKRIAELSK